MPQLQIGRTVIHIPATQRRLATIKLRSPPHRLRRFLAQLRILLVSPDNPRAQNQEKTDQNQPRASCKTAHRSSPSEAAEFTSTPPTRIRIRFDSSYPAAHAQR